MARRHVCNECGSEDIRVEHFDRIPPEGELLPNPFGERVGIYHRDAPLAEIAAAIETYKAEDRRRGLALILYARAYPGGLTDWEVVRKICEAYEQGQEFWGLVRTSDGRGCNSLREIGWTYWTDEIVRDPYTNKPNGIARLTDRGAEQLRLAVLPYRHRRKKIVRRGRAWGGLT